MKLNLQKKLAAKIFKSSRFRVRFEPDVLDEIKEGLTKSDMRGMIARGLVSLKPKQGVSRVRARKNAQQRAKGLRKGPGKRKGSKNARQPTKGIWINKIRLQRGFIKELYDKEYLSTSSYRDLYKKAKGGFFRSKRHIKLYIDDNDLSLKNSK